MSQSIAYIALVLVFALPGFVMGIYFNHAYHTSGRRSGDPARDFSYLFSAFGIGVIVLGIIGCFI